MARRPDATAPGAPSARRARFMEWRFVQQGAGQGVRRLKLVRVMLLLLLRGRGGILRHMKRRRWSGPSHEEVFHIPAAAGRRRRCA